MLVRASVASDLDTTPNVLKALDQGEVDRGQFAMFNTVGGLYEESLYAVAEHTFKIIEKYAIKIRHSSNPVK
jgi:prephenate dehydratase